MKVIAYVTYEVETEFEDDGIMDIKDQAIDAVRMEAPSGDIVDIDIDTIIA